MREHLNQDVHTLASCVKITRRDGKVVALTDHHEDLVVLGQTYRAALGYVRTAITTAADLEVDNLDLKAILDSDSIYEPDVTSGLYDGCDIELFAVNYADVTQGIIRFRKASMGAVGIGETENATEVRGLKQKLSQSVGGIYQTSCRAKFGDSKCKINLATYARTATVTALDPEDPKGAFYINVIEQDPVPATETDPGRGYFDGGKLTFSTGANSFTTKDVLRYRPTGYVKLATTLYRPVVVGDVLSIVASCGNTYEGCLAFNNILNFRGEPFCPGEDAQGAVDEGVEEAEPVDDTEEEIPDDGDEDAE
jgi:uncharacterized phage protein (TIGR02218 family)